jgi:hypothetical protein
LVLLPNFCILLMQLWPLGSCQQTRRLKIGSTGKQMDKLIEAALQAKARAVAPYSQFRVGAAIETAAGKIYAGCNIESSSFGLTCCAERVAIFKALSEGERDLRGWRWRRHRGILHALRRVPAGIVGLRKKPGNHLRG